MRSAPIDGSLPPLGRLIASHTRRRTGFTLLELMLVMAIIVIMGAIAYPSIDNYFGYFKLSGAADSLKGSWSQRQTYMYFQKGGGTSSVVSFAGS